MIIFKTEPILPVLVAKLRFFERIYCGNNIKERINSRLEVMNLTDFCLADSQKRLTIKPFAKLQKQPSST